MEVKMPSGIGSIVALVVLVLCIVFWATGGLPPMVAILIGLLAIARLT